MGLFDFIFARGEVDRGRTLDAQLAAENRALVDRGLWNEADYNAYTQRAAASSADNYNAQIQGEFIAGAEEGLANTQKAFKGALTGAAGFTLRGVFGFVPWWIWLAGGIYILFRLGLLDGILKRK